MGSEVANSNMRLRIFPMRQVQKAWLAQA